MRRESESQRQPAPRLVVIQWRHRFRASGSVTQWATAECLQISAGDERGRHYSTGYGRRLSNRGAEWTQRVSLMERVRR